MQSRRLVYYILIAFITGNLLLLYIQYNSSKNINALIKGGEDYLAEYSINADLKSIERNVLTIESNVSDFISTGDSVYLKALDNRIAQVKTGMGSLQKISDDDSTIQHIDALEALVNDKIHFSGAILDSFKKSGKPAAEKLIGSLRGKRMMDDIYSLVQRIETARHSVITKLTAANNRSGENAQWFNIILIIIVLVSGASLFWYIIHIIQELIRSQNKLEQVAQVKQNFLANMSHEIRTPMNAIIGFTGLLQQERLGERGKEYVQTIQKSGENLLTIINDILDLSKIEAGMMRIEAAPFNVNELVASVEAMFREKAQEKQIHLYTSIDKSVPGIVEGDATRLTQILINLVGNAIKFTDKGTVCIEIGCVNKTGTGVDVTIKVKDTGIGIAQEKINDMFERFKQADDAVTRKFGGTGLGLAIVKELVLLQKGSIKAESQEGIGTTICVNLPYKIAGNKIQSLTDTTMLVYNQLTTTICILVVEDNDINQSLVRHLLNSWGLQFDIAANGRLAIELLQHQPGKYQLVLMDIQMPEMDGYTAAQEIRQRLKLTIPIIAMTAHALAGEKEKCIAAGMNDYISKPIRQDELYNLISRFSENKTAKEIIAPLKTPLKTGTSYQYIHLQYMKEISGGDIEYEKTVTEQFIQCVPADLAAIQAAWAQQNLTTIRQLAHNMKTTISIMGLDAAVHAALDSLEHDELSKDIFNSRMDIICRVCNAALVEAAQLSAALQILQFSKN